MIQTDKIKPTISDMSREAKAMQAEMERLVSTTPDHEDIDDSRSHISNQISHNSTTSSLATTRKKNCHVKKFLIDENIYHFKHNQNVANSWNFSFFIYITQKLIQMNCQKWYF